MRVWNTFYDFPLEGEFAGAQDTPLYRTDGTLIAYVPRAFAASFCIEGSGKLADGRVVNYGGGCANGLDCNALNPGASVGLGSSACYTVLDAGRYPWGVGNGGRPLVPLRSIATDHAVIPLGSRVYIHQFDGLAIPQVGDLGGFTHDGYFDAVDSGGAITGDHIDIFTGSQGMYRALAPLVPGHSRPGVTNLDLDIVGAGAGKGAGAVGTGAIVAIGAAGAGGLLAHYYWPEIRRWLKRHELW